MDTRTDPMTYLPDMEQLPDSAVLERVLAERKRYDPQRVTVADVRRALACESLSPADFGALLSPAAAPFLEEIAQRAARETRAHFGNAVQFFTPLYLANYCENQCVYCGFNCKNQIRRARLTPAQAERELRALAGTGLQEILLLTGESRAMSDVTYIGEAVALARRYFRVVGLEIYPVNTDEYAYLHAQGADYVTVFQETYDPARYEALHLAGHKRVFPYRLCAQERALRGGMRGVGFAALLGLADWRRDAFSTGMHAFLLQRKYPHAEIAFSCPRLRPIQGGGMDVDGVSERELLQVICAYRIFMPYASITISTRERAAFRDHVIGLAATKISAGVSTGVGAHEEETARGDEQFEISDPRSVSEVYEAVLARGLQPVMADALYV